MNEASGDRLDSHENGYDLTLSGTLATNTGLVYPTVAEFDMNGTQYLTRARASCPLINFGAGDAFSIMAWVYHTAWDGSLDDSPTYYRYIISLSSGSAWSGGYSMKSTGDTHHVLLGRTPAIRNLIGTTGTMTAT